MKKLTADLMGMSLNYAVAIVEGYNVHVDSNGDYIVQGYRPYPTNLKQYYPSGDWERGGPIIERERIRLDPRESEWQASYWDDEVENFRTSYGPTALIAAMRCYVHSKLGNAVDIPEEMGTK